MSLRSRITWAAAVGGILALAAPPSARADDDLSASIFTDNGFELRRDDRIFALYAAFNVAGYDRAEVVRSLPFPRYALHPLRRRVRQDLAATAVKARPGIEQLLDAHPVGLGTYVDAALTLGSEAPFAASAQTPREFADLGKTLAEFAAVTHLAKVTQAVAESYRDTFKRLRSTVDAPFGALRHAYRLNEEDAPTLVLVPNPLDAPDAAFAHLAADGSHVVVFGLPADEKDLDLKPALRAYSGLLAEQATANASVEGLAHAVARLHEKGVLSRDVTEETLLRESLRAAVEAKLWSDNAAEAADRAFHKGLIFTPDLLKALDAPADAFPADKGPFAAQVAAGVNIDQALARLEGGADPHN